MSRGRTAYNVAPLWEPASVLPSQLVPRAQPDCAEMRMVTAVFDDALHCVLRNADVRQDRRGRDFREAWEWFWDDSRDWPFAFANVCDLLGLDMAAVRQNLRDVVATSSGTGPSANTSRQRPRVAVRSLPARAGSSALEKLHIVGWDEV